MKKNIIKYNEIVNLDRIIATYHRIMVNTKHRGKVLEYNMFYMSNLINIYNKSSWAI